MRVHALHAAVRKWQSCLINGALAIVVKLRVPHSAVDDSVLLARGLTYPMLLLNLDAYNLQGSVGIGRTCQWQNGRLQNMRLSIVSRRADGSPPFGRIRL